jgi:hypothetical protein
LQLVLAGENVLGIERRVLGFLRGGENARPVRRGALARRQEDG